MAQPLYSDEAAKRYNNITFKVSLTARELDFMIFQMEASIDACYKIIRHPSDPIEEDPHFQGLKRILTEFRDAFPK